MVTGSDTFPGPPPAAAVPTSATTTGRHLPARTPREQEHRMRSRKPLLVAAVAVAALTLAACGGTDNSGASSSAGQPAGSGGAATSGGASSSGGAPASSGAGLPSGGYTTTPPAPGEDPDGNGRYGGTMP